MSAVPLTPVTGLAQGLEADRETVFNQPRIHLVATWVGASPEFCAVLAAVPVYVVDRQPVFAATARALFSVVRQDL